MSKTPPSVPSSDPSVQKQVERENAAILGKSLTAAPAVSGSEVVYPRSTTSTSKDAVTITTSTNNDSGDITTVYTTRGQITVNPINQTINQYTAVDSGVSSIIPGNGIAVSSASGDGKGAVTISTTGLGDVAVLNLDGNVANVLRGDGTWGVDAISSYGNSNVASYLPSYNGTIAASNVTYSGNIGINAGTESWNFGDDGLFTAPGNVNLLGTRLNIGHEAPNISLQTPTIVIADSSNTFVQAALFNNDANGSADWVAYGTGGSDSEGWTDIGFAGPTFSDENYTITNPGDGYLFVQGYANVGSGSLILATGDLGNEKDIIISTGGFTQADAFARFEHSSNLFRLVRPDSGIQFEDSSIQNTAWTGNLVASNTQYQQTNTYYVDPARTDSYTESGTIIKPFKTISAAISAAVAAGYNEINPAFIVLLGNITENVTMQPGVWLTSFGTGTHGSPILTGTLTISSSTGTITSNHYSVSNLRIVAPTNGTCIDFVGTAAQRLFVRDIWLDANGTGTCIFMNNLDSTSKLHLNTGHLTHSGTGDIYCVDVTAGNCLVNDIETSGNVQFAAVRAGAVMTIDSSEISANNAAAVEVYGGSLTISNSFITNSQPNSNGVALNTNGSVCTLLTVLFNIPAGTGKAVVGTATSTLYYLDVAFFPGSNSSKTAEPALIASQLPTSWT